MVKVSRCQVISMESSHGHLTMTFRQEKDGDIFFELEQVMTHGVDSSKITVKLDEEIPDYCMLKLKEWLCKILRG